MPPSGQVIITLGADGRINVQCAGPACASQLAVVGLLELAKGAVLQQPAAPASPLILPRGGLPPVANGKGA